MFDIVSSALRVSLVTFVLCGFAYPFAVTVLGQLLTPFQAHGSLATNADGVVLGSQLIGQNWTDPKWFHGRPSATTDTDPNDSTKTIPAPYNAASSSASNLGPTSKALQDRLADDRKVLDAARPFGHAKTRHQRAHEGIAENGRPHRHGHRRQSLDRPDDRGGGGGRRLRGRDEAGGKASVSAGGAEQGPARCDDGRWHQ